MPKDKNDETFEDLFEPFQPEEYPPEGEPALDPVALATPVGADTGPTVICPSCGAHNPEHNRHCEQCGARISQGPLPVAPPPMMRSTPGARALTVLAGVVLLVVLVAVVLNLLGGEEGGPTLPTVTTTDTDADVDATDPDADAAPADAELRPASVEATSELPNYDAAHLIDGDISTYWNDNSQRGEGARLTFNFAQPVAITEMELVNIQDDEAFRRNYRIQHLQVEVDDLAIELPFTMPDNNEPARMPLNTLETRRVTVTVTGTYPGQPVGDAPSFTELALAEVRFFGSGTP